MKLSCYRNEMLLVAMALLLGVVLRCSHASRMAVEHFDEGVYSSSLWFDDSTNEGYPGRQFFAPPGFPFAIKVCSWIVPADLAPFVPSLIFGSFMVLLVWLTARLWFGQIAGLISAFLVAGSDYHIVFSRTALTDVSALAWITASVLVGSVAVHRLSIRWMIAAGTLCGLAWFTKYTGWLPVAILTAGTGLWWLLVGRKAVSIWKMFQLLGVLLGTVGILWLPLNWWLQPVGGYNEVVSNHQGYWEGFVGWRQRLLRHYFSYRGFDSVLSSGCLGLGMIAAATRRWIELKRSTWNASQNGNDPVSEFPSSMILFRLVGAAVLLTVLASVMNSAVILLCVGIGGMAGLVVWPTLSDLYTRRIAKDLSPEDRAFAGSYSADLEAAPSIDPQYGACLVFVWFLGLSITVPAYHPYPRLSLPLLAVIWFAASAGLAWWMEATFNVARRSRSTTGAVAFRRKALERMTTIGIVIAIALVYSGAGKITPSRVWQDRTSLRDASWQLAQIIQQDVNEEWTVPAKPIHLTREGMIAPRPEPVYDDEGKLIPHPTEFEERIRELPGTADRSSKLFDPLQPDAVLYGFGEPAVLMHARAAGLVVNPVQTTTFGPATLNGKPLPTYLVFGPNALASQGIQDGTSFMHDWVWVQDRFEHVADVRFHVSELVLLNLFEPAWLRFHPEASIQKLELYRLK